MEEKEREPMPASAPSGKPNELYEKHVFSDTPLKPSEQVVPADEPETEAETIAFDRPTVLDKAYAERRADPVQPQMAPARRVTHAPSARRVTPKTKRFPDRLYSGETPKEAVRRMIREFCILLVFLLLVCVGFWGKGLVVDFFTNDAYTTIYQSTKYAEPVSCTGLSAGATALNDGCAAAQLVCTQRGAAIPAEALSETEETLFPDEVAACMASALSDEQVQVRAGMSNRDLLVRTYQSLQENRPVIVLLATEQAGETSLQYAVVTAMNTAEDTITVLSPDDGTKTYAIADFLAATRFDAYDDMPLDIRLGLTFGSFARNTAIFTT